MKIRTNTRTTHTLTTDAGVDLQLAFEPVGDPLVHETKDTVVVAYMIRDNDCENPMTSNDGEGVLYMLREGQRRGYGAYNPEVYAALGLQSDGTPDIDATFNHGAGFDTLRGLATLALLATNPGLDLHDDAVFAEHEEAIDNAAVAIYAEHWQAIAGPFVVPVASYNEGRVGVTTWDGDHLDLPDGVWVACANAADNIRSQHLPEGVSIDWRGALGSETEPLYAEVTHNGVQVFTTQPTDKKQWAMCVDYVEAAWGKPTGADLLASAIKYANGVLEQYSAWASSECYGLTVEIFERNEDGTWDEAEGSRENECWGYCGFDYAMTQLRDEYYIPATESLQPAAAA